MKVVRLSAVRTGRLVLLSVRGWVNPRPTVAAWKIMSMKNPNDIGNRTRNLMVCSAVPELTAPPRAPCRHVRRVLDGLEHAECRDGGRFVYGVGSTLIWPTFTSCRNSHPSRPRVLSISLLGFRCISQSEARCTVRTAAYTWSYLQLNITGVKLRGSRSLQVPVLALQLATLPCFRTPSHNTPPSNICKCCLI